MDAAGTVQHGRVDAIDALKGLAIISVLLLHAVPREFLFDSFAVFHIWQAVPVLIVLMGYTGVMTRVHPLKDYARRRALRLLVPLGVVWMVSLGIALLRGTLAWDPMLLVGVLPTAGPGNYFITMVLEFALLLPVLRWLLDRGPTVLMVVCILADVGYQLLAGHFGWDGYLHSASVFRVLFLIGLGMLLASGHRVWPLAPFSVAFLVARVRGWGVPFFVETWQTQSFLAAGYPATLVEFGLRGGYPRQLSRIGRASYHIFLVQILWFGSLADPSIGRLGLPHAIDVLTDVVVCLSVGIAFEIAEQRLTRA